MSEITISLGHQRYSGPAPCERYRSLRNVLTMPAPDGCPCVSCEGRRYSLKQGVTYEREQAWRAEIDRANRRAARARASA